MLIRQSSAAMEDMLSLLPRRPVQQFARKRVIYDCEKPDLNFYVVLSGRVKLSQTASDGTQTVVRIVAADGFFGESAILKRPLRTESAVALDAVRVMSWTVQEIEQQIHGEPRLGLALVQAMVRQCLDLENRIQCMATCKTPERVAMALLQLAEAIGTREEDGTMRIAGITHHTLAEFVGTSREIVTYQLNRLRRAGSIKYTRKFIDVRWEALAENLKDCGVPLPAFAQPASSAAGV